MRASDSEGSNHRAAIEMLNTKVIWAFGAGAGRRGGQKKEWEE